MKRHELHTLITRMAPSVRASILSAMTDIIARPEAQRRDDVTAAPEWLVASGLHTLATEPRRQVETLPAEFHMALGRLLAVAERQPEAPRPRYDSPAADPGSVSKAAPYGKIRDVPIVPGSSQCGNCGRPGGGGPDGCGAC